MNVGKVKLDLEKLYNHMEKTEKILDNVYDFLLDLLNTETYEKDDLIKIIFELEKLEELHFVEVER